MKRTLHILVVAFAVTASVLAGESPADAFTAAFGRLADIYAPGRDAQPRTFSAKLQIARSSIAELRGHSAVLQYQAPDKLRIETGTGESFHAIGRDGNDVWFYSGAKKWGVIGRQGVPRFASMPGEADKTVLPPFSFPERAKVALLPSLCSFDERPVARVDGLDCRVIAATPTRAAQEALKIPAVTVELAIPHSGDGIPRCIAVNDGAKFDLSVDLHILDPSLAHPSWIIPAESGARVETTAISHFLRFAQAAVSSFKAPMPTLGDATGERELVAASGAGRLELHDGVRVLFLQGTPAEMGRQQGTLLRHEVRDVVQRILYGVGVGSSLAKGRWFFGEIEEAQSRLQPHMDARFLTEMDALADAAGLAREEVRLANYFPELFHCSGFALMGSATEGGRMYHGRVLDYLAGVGLERNAVVTVLRPDVGNAWVNIGYAGFIGTVTAMNEKRISIGEMGGRGEGHWDGKPMAQLLRDVMEKAGTLDQALDLMRRAPRTCEYYYVIADAKAKRAVGVKATPELFEVVEAGAAHPQLPEPVTDCVLLSAGERYTELVRRAKAGFGRFDAESARALMTRPVCMNSNIHSVLFAPDTLDFWVANADGKNPASHTRYRKFNLAGLLEAVPAEPRAAK
jgi:hypothetical protein